MREESRRLGPGRERLVARYELYRESFQLDLARYQAQSERRDRITSGKMVTGWVRSDEDLGRGVEEVTARIGMVLSVLEEVAATLTSVEVEGRHLRKPGGHEQSVPVPMEKKGRAAWRGSSRNYRKENTERPQRIKIF